jgi:hypothetical protein
MPPAINRETNAYARELWEKALQSEKGIKIGCEHFEAATLVRQAMYAVRKYDRLKSKEIYEKEHPNYGASDWDAYRITLHEVMGKHELRVEPQALAPVQLTIEDL